MADAAPDPEPRWHALAADQIVAALATDAAHGMSSAEAARRRETHGENALPAAPRRSSAAILAAQFKNPLIYLLLGAAVLALALGEITDGVVIAAVVLLNAVIGAYQEGRAERALAALRRMAGSHARVIRDGQAQVVDVAALVPGDVVELAAGDAVAADARLLEGAALAIAEAALTGESVPVSKDRDPTPDDAALADRRSMVFAGTHVTAGRARAVVVGTGAKTEIGRIAALSEAATPPPTPLERRVAAFGRHVLIGAAGLFAILVAVGSWRDLPFGQLLMLAISQVVGVVPEGLPVAMTIALATGVQRMARRRAIVRRLAAVETLGSTTIICSDKTGTLTRNEMTVTSIYLPGRRAIEVEGIGYAPRGGFREDGQALAVAGDAQLEGLLVAALLCNDARVVGPADDGSFRAVGDPTEAALITVGLKAGLVPDDLAERHPRIAELPFDAAHKLMATQHRDGAGERVILKGAPEAVLALCSHALGQTRQPLDAAGRAAASAAEEMAGRALRVLAIAVVEPGTIDGHAGFAALRGQATLLGLVGQIDPPRPEAAAAVACCRSAGIRPVMVTGDHKTTASAIARTLGIAGPDDLTLEGAELERLTEAELDARLDRVRVFARVQPAQKLRIVAAYQRAGEVVAMTGDGVNDAPGLVRADVGVAMGVTGTDVAKEAATIVLTDDDFATIVAAVEEGRVVYRNIKKAVLFLFTTSIAEVLVLLAALLLGLPAPFVAVQILWNNLVTEGVITVNLIMDPAEGDEMRRAPTPTDEPLITRAMWTRILFMTPAIVAAVLGWYAVRLHAGVPAIVARSEAFTLLVVCEWWNVLNCRSETRSALDLGVLRNRWLLGGLVVGNLLQVAVIFLPAMNGVFHTAPIDLVHVVLIGVVGSAVLWVEELRKWRARRLVRPPTACP